MVNEIIAYFLRRRLPLIRQAAENPINCQKAWFDYLIRSAKDTAFGSQYGFVDIANYETFKNRVPVHSYEDFFPYIERMLRGERNVSWKKPIQWFSKSSGTTNAKSKFIPVNSESLYHCHFKAGKDLYTLYAAAHPDTKIWGGKVLGISGSHQPNEWDTRGRSRYGDISGVIIQNVPWWVRQMRMPSLATGLMTNWEEKIERIIEETAHQNITHMGGVPTWTALILEGLLKKEGKSCVSDVWPNLEVFFHGAVSFEPYRQMFDTLIKRPDMRYWETYNASEGFFALQDTDQATDMRLLVDHGIFYEFYPLSKGIEHSVDLSQVETGVQYAMVISTNAGLWRYQIGDTVKFSSTRPYRLRITGRTKHFINAFGEEIIVENAEAAITQASRVTQAIIENYTAAPIFLDKGKRGGHEWIVEFAQPPTDIVLFTQILDDTLKKINTDYEAKRSNDTALAMPVVRVAPKGVFYAWMKKRGKLGGQHKVPRLYNSRDYVEELLALCPIR